MRRLLFLLFPALLVLNCSNEDDMPCATCNERGGYIWQNLIKSSSSSSRYSSSSVQSSSSRMSSSSRSSSSSSQPIVLCRLSNGNCDYYAQDFCASYGGSVVSTCSIMRSVGITVENSSGNGWSYNYIRISVNGGEQNYYVTLDGGDSDYYIFDFYVGDVVRIYWIGEPYSYPEECAFTIRYIDNNRILVNKPYGTLQSTSENELQVGQFTVAAP